MRAKRILAFSLVIVLLLVAIALVRNLGNQHRFIDTSGEIVLASDQGTPEKSHIFVEKKDGGGLVQLTTGNENDIDPSFSPDGSQIVYVSDKSGSPQVWVMDSDGQGGRAVTIGTDAKLQPRFGPDGVHLAYLASGRFYISNLDTGDTTLVLPSQGKVIGANTENLAKAVRQPVSDFTWSPLNDVNKGQVAAIQQTPDGDLETVALIPWSGGKPNVILGAREVSVAWSPDGSQLAVAAIGVPIGGKSVSGIFVYNADGTPLQQPPLAMIQGSATGPQQPAYTPDGTKIAFGIVNQTSIGADTQVGIALTPTTPGSNPQILAKGSAQLPQFSPDGSGMLFLAPSATTPANQSVYTVNLSNGHAGPIPGLTGNVSSAQWSPAKAKAKS